MTGSEAPSPTSRSFRLAYVPGVTPTKWVRIWNERLADVPLSLVAATPTEVFDVLREGGADAGFVRLPVDRADLAAIPLYTETTVVVIPKDHVIAAVEEITADDLAEELVLHPLDDTLVWEQLPGVPAKERPATTADAIELVAAGVGVLIVPQSLARLHHRKDLTYRTVTGTPESRIALSWPHTESGEPTELVEHFIGIVRGRTVNSTRGPALPKNTADAKNAKKQKRTEKPKQSPRKPAAKGGGGSTAKPKPGGGRAVAKNSRNTPKRGKPRR